MFDRLTLWKSKKAKEKVSEKKKGKATGKDKKAKVRDQRNIQARN